MKNIFNFKEQLAVGNKGEKDFIDNYSSLKPEKSKERAIDFILEDGKTVELKSDSYDMNATENFFIEVFSNCETGTIGGPYRALKDNIDFFVYYFLKNKIFFWFDTKELCKLLEIITPKCKTRNIKNTSWTTMGYLVPRELLRPVIIKEDKF